MAASHKKMPRRVGKFEVLKKGRRQGEGNKTVPLESHKAMVALYDIGWMNSDIGAAWGISASWAAKLIKKYKLEEKLKNANKEA